MSEYQYYEFQAVDRPLSKSEMAELRQLSTRATITPTRFVNVYNWGDFRGDPRQLMERYFDAFIYVTNWGTHWLMLRLPRQLLAPASAAPYLDTDEATLHVAGDWVILSLRSEDEEGDWEETDDEGWLPSLLPLRGELASGDLRSLYLAWLLSAETSLDEGSREPPVPPGLGHLSAPLTALVEFLRLDPDLVAVAAERSPASPSPPTRDELARWIGALAAATKDDLLLRAATGDHPQLRGELLRGYRAATTPAPASIEPPRTVGELLAAAAARTEARLRAEAEREARERRRRAQEEAARRAAYLDDLARRAPAVWREVETLIETKRPADYDRATQLLVDLRDLAARQGEASAFATRLAPLRARHAKKVSFIARLDQAGLSG